MISSSVPMQITGYTALAPTIILALTALALFIIDSIHPKSTNSRLLAGVSLVGTLIALVVTGAYLMMGVGLESAIELFESQLIIDGMSLFFTFIFTSVTALVSLASFEYLRDREYQAEYYILILLAATGMTFMASSNSLATAFVSLELASLPSYALVAYLKDNKGSVEAGLKYFLIGSVSSAIFVYGISLVYATTGSLLFSDIAEALQNGVSGDIVGVLGFGILMIIGGLAFKTASVPFHFWAPEAYEARHLPFRRSSPRPRKPPDSFSHSVCSRLRSR